MRPKGIKRNAPCIEFVQGVPYMCRRNQLLGCVFLAFGLGLLTGNWLESGVFCHLFGFLAVFWGVAVCRRK